SDERRGIAARYLSRRVALGDQDGAHLSRIGNGRRCHVARHLGALWKSCHEGRPKRTSVVQDKWWNVSASSTSTSARARSPSGGRGHADQVPPTGPVLPRRAGASGNTREREVHDPNV